MTIEPRRILENPVVKALRPVELPYLDRLTVDADLHVWHIDVNFEEFSIPPHLRVRWSDSDVNTAETWRKRPLAMSDNGELPYSCGEVELVARLRRAGIEAVWISEWSGFPHVDIWRSHCVKRSEFRQRAPAVWEFDRQLRAESSHREALGGSGGHPDIAAVTPRGYVFLEYKGPGDLIRPKQRMWAETLIARESPRLVYLVIRGFFSFFHTKGAGRTSLHICDPSSRDGRCSTITPTFQSG